MKIFGPDAQDDEERRLALVGLGPRLPVVVANPLSQIGVRQSKRTEALIDTGASDNLVDIRLAQLLGPQQIDTVKVGHVTGSQLTPVFYAKLTILDFGYHIEGRLYGGNTGQSYSRYNILLGRPFLSDFVMNYNGLRGLFEMGDQLLMPGPVIS